MSNSSNFESYVQSILVAAEQSGKELTYQQACSIFIRHNSLRNESASHPAAQQKFMEKQVDECYRQRERQRNG